MWLPKGFVCWLILWVSLLLSCTCTQTTWCRWHHQRCLFILPVFLARSYGRLHSQGSHSWYYLHGWEGWVWGGGSELHTRLPERQKVRIMDAHHLMISSFRCDFDDTAQYRVSAMNSKGELSAFASVVVKSRFHFCTITPQNSGQNKKYFLCVFLLDQIKNQLWNVFQYNTEDNSVCCYCPQGSKGKLMSSCHHPDVSGTLCLCILHCLFTADFSSIISQWLFLACVIYVLHFT